MCTKFKCIKENCPRFYSSDNYFETCQLVSKYVLIDKCYGIEAIPERKEEIACKIQKLIGEFTELGELEQLIKNKQD